LAGRQQELLQTVVATGKPVVLVLINGRPLNISWAAEHVPAILVAWEPGSQGGHAVADILFGDANPAGKLTVTWPRLGDVPSKPTNFSKPQVIDETFREMENDRTEAQMLKQQAEGPSPVMTHSQ
jgi:hypothetical protein